MKMAMLALLSILGACNTLPSDGLPVVPGHLVMEHRMLPGQFRNDDGSTYIAHLDAIIVRPDDDQVHPLAILNHGTNTAEFRQRFVDEFKERAIEFARRGWVAVAFSRRGYGRSEGNFVEGMKECTGADFARRWRFPAADIREAIRFMQKESYVDASKVISVGVSGGGYATIALTASPVPGLVASINFAGGVHPFDVKKIPCYDDSLTEAAAIFGKSARIPMLWIYAENDHVVPQALGKRMYAAFSAAGGNAEFIAAPKFTSYKNDGHYLFRYGIPIWSTYVDAFLKEHGLQQMDGLISVSEIRIIDSRNMNEK